MGVQPVYSHSHQMLSSSVIRHLMLYMPSCIIWLWPACIRGSYEGSSPWMQGLPAWNILLLGRKPFAVSVYDCSAIPAVVSAAEAKVLSFSLPCDCDGSLHDAS